MTEGRRIGLGKTVLLEFSGPDAVRFLNGQLTQDVRKVAGAGVSLPSCVTDAKGKLQFRVFLTEGPGGALWVSATEGAAEALEGRLTRYLIADEVEVRDLSGDYELTHVIGAEVQPVDGVVAGKSRRFGVEGEDWWVPVGMKVEELEKLPVLAGGELEALRIRGGVPSWGKELEEGLLPPEAGLDASDISYAKGCYIGQEVISRIKSAGKVNKRLAKLSADAGEPLREGDELWSGERAAGVVTSVSPLADGEKRLALGYVKRGTEGGLLEVRKDGGGFGVNIEP